jgi:C4-dicarboxylate transporter DctQ subunit
MTATLHRLEEGVVALLLVGVTLLVFAEVVLRFAFNMGFGWMQEVSLYLGAWLVLIGASYALREGAQISVDALVNLLPRPAKRYVSLLAAALSLLYCLILLASTWAYLGRLVDLGLPMQEVPIPRWLGQSCLMIGFLLLAGRLVVLMQAILRGDAAGFKTVDEAQEALDALAHQSPAASAAERRS